MPLDRTIVLKLGGSVLRDELQMRSAVHEVYRWRREGWLVVAVVSALTGRTDELLQKCAHLYKRRSPLTEASVASCGESESAALLGLHLDRAGIPASVLAPGAVKFVASGHPLDATPRAIDTALIHDALDRCGTVVFPAYVATAGDGATVALGRGGSDLTALYLARELGAERCRLIKDVDGLYDRDPSSEGPPAERFSHATFEDALATDGSILQHKAVAFARDSGTVFEVSRPNGFSHTQIGRSERAIEPPRQNIAPLRIALVGHGTVGEGVLDLLENLSHFFQVTAVSVRSPEKHPRLRALPAKIYANPVEAAESDVDVVMEVMGGVTTATKVVERAALRGTHVVTANKSLLAEHGVRLRALADVQGSQILGSASVGAAAPIIEAARQRGDARVNTIRAVLNGTSNFILNAVSRGVSFSTALADAQTLGFAEEDPGRDLAGLDAADKLRVLAQELGLDPVGEQDVPCDALCEAIEARSRVRGTHRQVATLTRDGSRAVCAVRIECLESADPLAQLGDEENAAKIEWEDGIETLVRGAGAGRWPTAEAVVADLLTLERERSVSTQRGQQQRGSRVRVASVGTQPNSPRSRS